MSFIAGDSAKYVSMLSFFGKRSKKVIVSFLFSFTVAANV